MIRFAALVFLLSMVVLGCSSNSTTPSTPSDTNDKNSFLLTASGQTDVSCKGFSADTASLAYSTGTIGSIAFTGRVGSSSTDLFTCNLTVPMSAPGSYPVNPSSGVSMTLFINASDGTKQYFAATGTIIIDTWTSTGVTGRFDGVLAGSTGSATIKNGKFDAKVITV